MSLENMTYVVVAAEEDEQRRRSRGHEDESVLRESIGVEETTALVLVADRILLLLVRTVQDREVEIRGRVVLSLVPRIRAEQHMRDERCIGERQGRVSSGVVLELQHSFRFRQQRALE